MKQVFYVLMFTICLGCISKESKQGLTELEAYTLLNDYFLKDLKKEDSLLLFNSKQLRSPDSMLLAELDYNDDNLDHIPQQNISL